MQKRKKHFNEIARVLAGEGRSNIIKGGWTEETELNFDAILEYHKNTRWGQIVTQLLKAGATRITIQNNPLWDKSHWWHDNFYIFIGYGEEQKTKQENIKNERTKKSRKTGK